jgi:nucleotide-binding universal stress UspA family protein
MNRVLVGVDGSSQSRDAVAFGALLAVAHGDQLQFVHANASGTLEDLAGAHGYDELVQAIVDNAIGGAPTAATIETVAERSPAVALRRVATRDDARAIVVGSSHRGRVGRVVPGGVAQHVLSSARCPVAVAPGGYADRTSRQLGRIGVASTDQPAPGRRGSSRAQPRSLRARRSVRSPCLSA